jgi:cell division control protein 6
VTAALRARVRREGMDRRAFHSSSLPPDIDLIGRERELKRIWDFLSASLTLGRGDSLYISGSPGTGKSACIGRLCRRLREWPTKPRKVDVVRMNGMTLAGSASIFSALAAEVRGKKRGGRAGAAEDPVRAKALLEKLFRAPRSKLGPRKKMTVVIIDEIDRLVAHGHQKTLYQIFEWPKTKNSPLVLIGIANAVDLTEKFLPRLRARELAPEILVFPPYTKDQLAAILQQRLRKLAVDNSRNDEDSDSGGSSLTAWVRDSGVDAIDGDVEVRDAAQRAVSSVVCSAKAVTYCANSIASHQAGDARKALDACRAAIETQQLKALHSASSLERRQSSTACQAPEQANAKTLVDRANSKALVEVGAMVRVLRGLQGSRSVTNIRNLPKQAMVLLCAASGCCAKADSSSIRFGDLEEIYVGLCRDLQWANPDSRVFVELLTQLKDTALVSVQGGLHHSMRASRSKRIVRVQASREDIEYAVGEKNTMLRGLLHARGPRGPLMLPQSGGGRVAPPKRYKRTVYEPKVTDQCLLAKD